AARCSAAFCFVVFIGFPVVLSEPERAKITDRRIPTKRLPALVFCTANVRLSCDYVVRIRQNMAQHPNRKPGASQSLPVRV
ncbi:hypothetical protein ACP5YT_004396, partial [Cronobacter malonaticus]